MLLFIRSFEQTGCTGNVNILSATADNVCVPGKGESGVLFNYPTVKTFNDTLCKTAVVDTFNFSSTCSVQTDDSQDDAGFGHSVGLSAMVTVANKIPTAAPTLRPSTISPTAAQTLVEFTASQV